eukprot:631756-Pelagomonas_calceolata.AAC.8
MDKAAYKQAFLDARTLPCKQAYPACTYPTLLASRPPFVHALHACALQNISVLHNMPCVAGVANGGSGLSADTLLNYGGSDGMMPADGYGAAGLGGSNGYGHMPMPSTSYSYPQVWARADAQHQLPSLQMTPPVVDEVLVLLLPATARFAPAPSCHLCVLGGGSAFLFQKPECSIPTAISVYCPFHSLNTQNLTSLSVCCEPLSAQWQPAYRAHLPNIAYCPSHSGHGKQKGDFPFKGEKMSLQELCKGR